MINILQVRVVPNFKHPRMSSARIVIANETVPSGSRANEGIEAVIHSQRSSLQDLKWKGTTPSWCPSVLNSRLLVNTWSFRGTSLSEGETQHFLPLRSSPTVLDPMCPIPLRSPLKVTLTLELLDSHTDSFTQGTQAAPEAKPLSLIQSQCRAARGKNLGKTSAQMGTKRPFAQPRVSHTPP